MDLCNVHGHEPVNLAFLGGAVKALGDGKVGGYLVRFSTEDDPDLQGDFFTTETDFGPHTKSLVYYHHALDKTIGKKALATDAELKADEVGVWCEAQLDMRDRYQKAIYRMVKAGKLGWSSGTADHLVEREAVRGTKGAVAYRIKAWPLGLDASLTPCPVEPRTAALPIKSLETTEFEHVAATLATASSDELRLGEGSESLRSATKGLEQRVRDYASLREIDYERAEELRALKSDFIAAIEVLDAALQRAPTPEGGVAAASLARVRLEAVANDPVFWRRAA